MIRAGVKQKFAEQFSLSKWGCSWFDLVALVDLDADRIAKLEVVETGTADSFSAIRVTLANRLTGTLDVKTFKFNDYLPFDMAHRSDTREDYKEGFSVWLHNAEFDWYIAKPKSVRPLVAAIEAYLHAWRR